MSAVWFCLIRIFQWAVQEWPLLWYACVISTKVSKHHEGWCFPRWALEILFTPDATEASVTALIPTVDLSQLYNSLGNHFCLFKRSFRPLRRDVSLGYGGVNFLGMEEIFAKWNENICRGHHASSLMILDRMLLLACRKIWTSPQIKMQILLLQTAIRRKAMASFSSLTAACKCRALNHSISLSV